MIDCAILAEDPSSGIRSDTTQFAQATCHLLLRTQFLSSLASAREHYIMTETFSAVPRVDFSRLNDPISRSEELLKLRDAIFVVGFLYLTNTGLEV